MKVTVASSPPMLPTASSSTPAQVAELLTAVSLAPASPDAVGTPPWWALRRAVERLNAAAHCEAEQSSAAVAAGVAAAPHVLDALVRHLLCAEAWRDRVAPQLGASAPCLRARVQRLRLPQRPPATRPGWLWTSRCTTRACSPTCWRRCSSATAWRRRRARTRCWSWRTTAFARRASADTPARVSDPACCAAHVPLPDGRPGRAERRVRSPQPPCEPPSLGAPD